MGSTSWIATTLFEPDVRVALRRAQEEVFARGEYGFTYKMTQLWRSIGKEPPPLPPEKKARTIDEAREIADASGTCSVLDVYDLGPEPAPGVAAPLTIDKNQSRRKRIWRMRSARSTSNWAEAKRPTLFATSRENP